MSVNFLISQAKIIQKVIDANASEIEKLDQNIGDGDHIFNVQRGLKLVVELESTIKDLPLSKALNMIAMKVLSGIGGSSGALFGTFFMSMAKTSNLEEVNFSKACEMIISGVNAMKDRGKADVGEKTMMDVLIPVSQKLNEIKNENIEKNQGLKEVIKIAEERMLATKDMLATKGRASFLGERAKGHIDPGARSSQLIIETICKSVINE
ncbi:dihydroxyacetone kinase subunit DhaL [Candidatus Pelagibacter sp. HIMB1542]|uniref:dihydroxyacetone kinase subunit DhaL n=1 Tax=Candidatus Pelagibacter sp. HIMB1542 TaxID=3413346 RepID=UPI003F85E0C1|tara:strand:- start:275 stop:901 length:627 start_codon:yes stop_codon:yes gene_type:complete